VKVLVTGANGQLGRAICERFSRSADVVGVDLPDGDLAQPAVADSMLADHQPDWVVHAAAFTAVDAAEQQQEAAIAGNVTATQNIAAACESNTASLTYISTDYVFQGDADGYDEESPRNPINHYGATKAQGEEVVEKLLVPWQIVRTSWLFGDGMNFVKTIVRLLDERDTLRVVADQVGSPTYAPDLAELISCLVSRKATGFFHGTNQGVCSWFEFAREIALLIGAKQMRIKTCTTAEYPTPARRPVCSVLRSQNLAAIGCADLPTWQDALRRYLAEKLPGVGTGKESG